MDIEARSALRESPLALQDPNHIAQTIQPLAQRSMFWRPAFLENSTWLEHIPFAFWLMEAQRPRVFVELGIDRGVSYFAFCQAVEKLGLDTRCFAIDTWKGDEQAVFYDENVFEKLNAYNEAQYSGFSSLMRGAFDDAFPYFSDGSIDLLHIDSLHNFEAISHDFQVWLPKLSERAVVIMHDTNIRESKFGVFRFLEGLKKKYPFFEFAHGHGLAVISVGPGRNELLQRLFEVSGNEQARRAIHDVFSRLGRACADSFAAAQQRERARCLAEEVEKREKELIEFRRQFEKAHSDFDHKARELSDTISRMQTQLEQHAVERGQLAGRVTLLQEIRAELKEEIVRYQGRIVAISSEFAEKNPQPAGLTSRPAEHQQRTEEMAMLTDEIAAVNASSREAQQKYIALHQQAIIRESELALLRRKDEERAVITEQLQQALNEQGQRLDAALADVQGRDEELAGLRELLACQTEEQGKTEDRLSRDEASHRLLEQQIQTLTAENQALVRSNEDRFKELAILTRQLEEREAGLQAKEKDAVSQQQRADQLDGELKAKTEALRFAEKQVAEARAQADAVLAQKDAALARLEAENKLLKNEQQALAGKLDNRSKDFTELTRQLEEREAGLQAKEKDAVSQQQRADRLEGELRIKTEELRFAEKQFAEARAQKDAALASLEAENKVLRSEQQALAGKLDNRSKDIAALTRLLEEREASLQAKEKDAISQQQRADQLDRELKTTTEALRFAEKQFAEARAQKDAALARFEAENKVLRNEQQALGKKLDDRFTELAILTRLLEERDHEAARQHAAGMKETLQRRLTAPFLGWTAEMKRVKIISKQVSIIEKSGLFDESWYLRQYPDVAADAGIKASEHYLLFGAFEGRNPGPAFNTKSYSAKHPEISEAGINPLLHYIQHEKKQVA